MGEWNIFWQWFPIGPAGMKTLLLLIPALVIYILRVAQIHIGQRTTTYPFETFIKYLFRFNTLQTFVVYSLSALLFGEVYIWSQPTSAKLGWIMSHERSRLNERSIYLRFVFFFLAGAQSAVHLYRDYDRVVFPVSKTGPDFKEGNNPVVIPARAQIGRKALQIMKRSGFTTLGGLVGGTLLYGLFLRSTLWEWNYMFARRLSSLAKSSRPGGFFALTDIFCHLIIEGYLLVFLWEFTNAAFDAYVSQEPLKKGKPITDDSKDPNGSLLIGLRTKKELPKNVAFWELALITNRFQVRRKSIYDEIDRKNGSTWKQILAVCLAEINNISSRIQAAQSPTPDPGALRKTQPIELVPRISQPLKDDKIAGPSTSPTTALGKFENFASDLVRTCGSSSPGPSPQAIKLLEYSSSLLTPERRAQLNPNTMTGWIRSNLIKIIRSPFGVPFRKKLSSSAIVVITGTPYSQAGTIVDAVTALTELSVASLKEDSLGQVYKDVPEIIRTFVLAIKNIDGFMRSLEVHWTDVDLHAKDENEKRKVPLVEEVVEALKSGLERILLAFGEYLESMGVTKTEIREAKELVVKDRKPARKEMKETK